MRVLLAGKPGDQRVQSALISICKYLREKIAGVKLFTVGPNNDQLIVDQYSDPFDSDFRFDFGVSVGGDGTVLHMNSLIPVDVKPPVIIPFSLGTLGFLLPFNVNDYAKVIDAAVKHELCMTVRDRLECMIEGDNLGNAAALNEIGIGRSPAAAGLQLTKLECSIDNRPLTLAIADGILVSTSTGSTAYSLSAGGPVMHPSCPALILTPICPRSLSFRPLVLPLDSTVLSVKNCGDSDAEVSMDGKTVGILSKGQTVHIRKAHHPIITLTPTDHEWIDRINKLLGWNRSFNSHE